MGDLMSRLVGILFLALAGAAFAGNNTLVGPATSVGAGDKIRADTYNDNFARIYAEVRGSIGTLNLLDQAVTTPKLGVAPNGVGVSNLNSDVSLQLVPTGTIIDYIGATAPSGWVFPDGKTIGDASSGGTERANADTSALFTLLWNSMTNTEAPVSTGRGASAAADFAAHKTITLPDIRGRVCAALDNLGGSTASRITATTNFDGTVNGRAGGSQNHTLITAELAAHNHGVNDPGHVHAITDPGHVHGFAHGSTVSVRNDANQITVCADVAQNTSSAVTGISINSNTTGISTQNNGSGSAHTVLQPTMTVSKIIKLYYPMEAW